MMAMLTMRPICRNLIFVARLVDQIVRLLCRFVLREERDLLKGIAAERMNISARLLERIR